MPDQLDFALALLRIVLGIVLVAHGIRHAGGRARTTRWFAGLGFRAPEFQWLASTGTEIGVGLLLVAGLLTSLAAAGAIGILAVAFWTVHRAAGFFVTARPDEGWEYVFTLAAVALAVAVAGPGEWSVDDALGIATDLDGWVGAVLAAGGAVVAAGQIVMFWRPGEAESD